MGTQPPEDETLAERKERRQAGRRIFVLTPQGETLQKYRFDEEVRRMVILGDKLIVKLTGPTTLRALKGL